MVEGQAAFLAAIRDGWIHDDLGFSSFGDLVREALKIDPRTARNRVALHRVLSARPRVRRAFLDGDVSGCQLLVLRGVLSDANEAFWISECSRLTVRELRERVREARRGERPVPAEEDDEETSASVSFLAPPAVWVTWDLAMETARRMLGWEAPIHRCVEAILAEAAPGDFPGDEIPERGVLRGGAADPKRRPCPAYDLATMVPIESRAARRARTTLAQVADVLEDIDDLVDVAPAAGPQRLLARVVALQSVERPVRILLGRVLRDLVATGAIHRLGYLRIAEFVEERLNLSERTGRTLVRECEIFSDCPLLEEAVPPVESGCARHS